MVPESFKASSIFNVFCSFTGCPATMMTRPCVTPGCTSCAMHSAAAAAAASTTPADLMMTFPPSFFAAAYSPLLSGTLPPTSR